MPSPHINKFDHKLQAEIESDEVNTPATCAPATCADDDGAPCQALQDVDASADFAYAGSHADEPTPAHQDLDALADFADEGSRVGEACPANILDIMRIAETSFTATYGLPGQSF